MTPILQGNFQSLTFQMKNKITKTKQDKSCCQYDILSAWWQIRAWIMFYLKYVTQNYESLKLTYNYDLINKGHYTILLAQSLEPWTVNQVTRVLIPRQCVTFVMIDHKILSTVTHTVPLLWYI
jgi:hypothetical protein